MDFANNTIKVTAYVVSLDHQLMTIWSRKGSIFRGTKMQLSIDP